MKRKNYTTKINPVLRAVVAAKWSKAKVQVQLQAYLSNDGLEVVHQAGRIFFVVLMAFIANGMSDDHPDVRILRGAVNALEEQAEVEQVDAHRRNSLISGLNAAMRLVDEIPADLIISSALILEERLKHGHVYAAEYREALGL
jgi:hypothetical protein